MNNPWNICRLTIGVTSSRITALVDEEDEQGSSSGILEILHEGEVSTSNIFRDSTSRKNLKESSFGRIFKDPSFDVEE